MRISDWSSDVCSSDLNPITAPSFATLNVVSRPGRNVASHSLWKNPPKSLSSIVKLRPSIASSLAARLIATPCGQASRSEEHTSELQSIMRNEYVVFILKKKRDNLITATHKRKTIDKYKI